MNTFKFADLKIGMTEEFHTESVRGGAAVHTVDGCP